MVKKCFLKTFQIIIIGLFLLASYQPVEAQDSPGQTPQKVAQADDAYLIPLEYPNLDEAIIPAGMNKQSSAHYIEGVVRRNAANLLRKLERLQAEGLVTRYTFLPNLLAIEVVTLQPEAVNEALGTQGTLVDAAAETSACRAKAGEALTNQALAQSRLIQMQATLVTPNQPDAATTNPSIQVYTTAYGYSNISGKTTSNAAVSLKIIRAGKATVNLSTYSDSGGYYRFRPNYSDCPNNSYDWTVRPGDMVEVSTAGGVASTIVASLSAWADPFTDIVAGNTAAGRIVEAIVYAPTGSPCAFSSFAKNTTTNSSGDFSLNFNTTVNFNGRAQVDIYAYDANDNTTTTYIEAYHLGNSFGSGSVNGVIKPNANYDIELERAGIIEAGESGVSDPGGYFYNYLGDVTPGDIVRVTSGGLTLSLTSAGFSAYLDPTTNLLSGGLGSYGVNRTVVGYFENAYRLSNTCNWDWYCNGAQANGSGNFTINPGGDILRGDDVYGYVYDSFGNQQFFSELTAPYIRVQASSTYINGYWRFGTFDPLTITHKDSANNPKWSGPVSYQDDWDGYFYGYSGSTVVAGDKIEVTDGMITESMTVSNLSGRLNSQTGHLSGSAGNGRLIADLWDLSPPYYYYYSCAESNISSGSYNLDLNSLIDFGGWDEADLFNAGPDGHYTYLYRYTFSVAAEKDGTSVWGYTETPGATANISLWRGGSQIASSNPVSSSNSYISTALSTTILEGDELRVQTSDGNSANLVVPKLTVNISSGNLVIYGKAPANQGVETGALRRYSSNSTWSEWMNGPSNASGDYSIDYSGMYWWTDFSEGCYQIGVGGACVWGEVFYHRPDGHAFSKSMNPAAAALVDGYENDDSAPNATPITGKQTHTFHQNGDVDWVKIEVTSDDIAAGVNFEFMTGNLGFGMDTIISLYDVDGATYLREDDDSGPGYASRLNYTFSTPGTYFLRIRPFDSTYDTAYCDAKYDVTVTSKDVFVPMVLNQP